MGKASAKAFKPHEVEAMARQQNRMNNPNQSNIFGSTTTTFGADDQASIVQELSPQMQGIINSQMDFVGQGPAQLGQFSNPFIEGLMQNTANSLARTGGWGDTPQSSQMGGFSGFNPQFTPQQQEIADSLNANPSAPIEIEAPARMPLPEPQAMNKPMALESIKNGLQAMGQASELQPVNTGVVNKIKPDASQLGQGLMAFLQQRGG